MSLLSIPLTLIARGLVLQHEKPETGNFIAKGLLLFFTRDVFAGENTIGWRLLAQHIDKLLQLAVAADFRGESTNAPNQVYRVTRAVPGDDLGYAPSDLPALLAPHLAPDEVD